MTLSESDRFQLVENYVEHIVDGMDTDSLAAMVVDLLTREYENLTEDQIKEEIVDLYDEETLEDLMPSWHKPVGCPTSWQGVTQNGHRGQNRVLYSHEQNTTLF